MARKIMRSLWDISRDVSSQALSTKPVGLVDDYTYGNRQQVRSDMIDGIPNSADEDIIKDDNHNGIPDDMEDLSTPQGASQDEIDNNMPDDILEVDIVEIEIVDETDPQANAEYFGETEEKKEKGKDNNCGCEDMWD